MFYEPALSCGSHTMRCYAKGPCSETYCESCVDAVDQVQLGIRVRGNTVQVVWFAAYIP